MSVICGSESFIYKVGHLKDSKSYGSFEIHGDLGLDFEICVSRAISIGRLKALVFPITKRGPFFLGDFFCPTLSNELRKTDFVASCVFACGFFALLDVATFAIRCVTIIPCAAYNACYDSEQERLAKYIADAIEINPKDADCKIYLHVSKERKGSDAIRLAHFGHYIYVSKGSIRSIY